MFALTELNDYNKYIKDNYTYYFNNKPVPRVTEIIHKMISEESIIQWANSLGFKHKGYTKAVNEAADLGTAVHQYIEMYLKNGIYDDTNSMLLNYNFSNCINAFKAWYDTITQNHMVNVLSQETPVVCEYYGGTYDLLIEIDGKKCLVDFKTTNKVTYKHFMQLSAYNRVLRSNGVDIQYFLILQLSKTSPVYTEYVVDLNVPEHSIYFDRCEKTFLSLLYSYYNIQYLNKEFSVIEKEVKR